VEEKIPTFEVRGGREDKKGTNAETSKRRSTTMSKKEKETPHQNDPTGTPIAT